MPDGLPSAVAPRAPLALITLGAPALRGAAAPNDTSAGNSAVAPASAAVTLFDLGKPLALITYIACSPERCVPREHLIDLLWGDVEPEAAKHALRQTLWYIRKRLGDRPLIAGGDMLSIVGALDCDRDHFLAAVADGDVESVVRLYTGEFFREFAAPGGAEFERWADIERQRLRSFFWRGAETLVRRWMSAGRLRDAQTLARRVRDTDPLRESGWRLLFETLIAAQDGVTGTLEADAFDRLVAAEGIEPEPATRSLLRVVRQYPPAASAPPVGQPASLFAELVGREQEFAQLLASWEAARGGKTTHVHLLAPAGLGKTRLLMDVNARLRATRVRTVFIRASLGARDIPFGLAGDLAEALAQLPGASGISTGSARTLVALNPALSASYPAALPDAAGGTADATRRRAVAVRELVAAVAEEQPLAIFIDDMQWADVRSRQLVASMVAALERSRVLVVSASRPTVDAIAPEEGSPTIRLSPLDAASVGALLASIAALPPELWAEQLPGELCDATGGSPLLVLETIQLAMEGGLLVRTEATWSAPRAGRLFATLGAGGALRQRVERLDRVERWVMTLLAVAGIPLTREAVTVAAGRSADEIAAALGGLERRGLAARHGEHWSPSHDEIAAMAAELALPDARRAAARSVGKMMLDIHPAGTRSLRQAGALLADADDLALLGGAFVRFARIARDAGDRQPNRALAADFLGERSTPELVAHLVRALPPLHRAGLYSVRRQIAAAGVSTAIPLLVLLNAFIVRQPPPDVVLAIGSVSADSVARIYRVPVRAAQLGSSHVVAVGSGRPAWRVHADPTMSTFVRHTSADAWTVDRVSADSGGIDLFDIADNGREQRLTDAAGDDQQPAWSPDGRFLVFFTARWDTSSHYDLAVLDARTKQVRPLTKGPDSDMRPAWSPDGSRIAFSRLYWDARPSEACVVDMDGLNVRCFSSAPSPLTFLGAWYDVNHVLVQIDGRSGLLGRLDVNSGAVDTLLRVRKSEGVVVSPNGRWALCECRRLGFSPNAALLFPLDDPNRVLELDVSKLGGRRRILAFESTPRRDGYVERIAIDAGLGAPAVGVAHRLIANGLTPNGDTTPLGSVRWTSLDTAVATIDSAGVLWPKRVGTARIQASAGGWRTATRDFAVMRRETGVLLDEDWSAGIRPTWRPFGYPKPRVDRAPDGSHALLNNGDGSFVSGVYSSGRYPTARGLALDAWISVHVTANHWQLVWMSLEDAFTDAELAGWDHSSGNLPRRAADWPSCALGYPSSEGVKFGDTLRVAVDHLGETRSAAVPPSFRTGAWFHLRLQIFPDGRCGVAINGTPVAVSQEATMRDSAVRVVSFGNSAGTQALVGPVRLRAGVPDDIDWSRADGAVPNAPPAGWSPESDRTRR
jgi:DNA-binding SARP family transcriptional activator